MKIEMNTPKVSIIVPIYNVEKYIFRCIDSLINQTLKEIEIILVDDESPDSCPQICDEYVKKDSRIKVIHKKNEGLGFARNSGMKMATGEYVAFVDSDDWVDHTMYETIYNIARKEELDAVYTEFNVDYHPGYHVILHNEQIFEGSNEIEKLMLDMVGPEPEYNSDVKFQVSACKAIYRLDLIKQYQISFHSERELISEDLVFNIDFLRRAFRVKTLPLQMYYYWLNPNSLTHSYRNNLWNRLSSFYEYLYSRQCEFSNQTEFVCRLNRTILLGVRASIGQEFRCNKDNKLIKQNILNIINAKYVCEVLHSYPFSRMPLKFFLFYTVISFRKIWLMKLAFQMIGRK